MGEWAERAKQLEELLRLRTFPVAWKRFQTRAQMEQLPRLRRLDHPVVLCQVFTLARTAGWTVGVVPEDLKHCRFTIIGGLRPPDEEHRTLPHRVKYWVDTPEDAQKMSQSMHIIPADGYEAIAVAPLTAEKFEPDVVMVYGNPAQLTMLLCGLQRIDYARFDFSFVGESACSDHVARCYVSGKPALTLPCYGERRLGHTQDDELVVALPPHTVSKTIDGLKALRASGIRYPIAFYGAETDTSPTWLRAYDAEAIKARRTGQQ